MLPVTVPLKDHTAGDRWPGILSIGPILVNGAPQDSPVASCSLVFTSSNGVTSYELTSVPTTGKGTITIVNAALWSFVVPEQFIALTAGKWDWTFKCRDADGWIETFYKGTLNVLK